MSSIMHHLRIAARILSERNSARKRFGNFHAAGIIGIALATATPVAAGPPGAGTNATAVVTNSIAWSTNWTDLLDGKSLTNWAITDFGGHGAVSIEDGKIKIALGDDLSGINWTNGVLPKTDYEISLDAERLAGSDFFCGLTFPVADSHCSLILGGWGGGLVGLSSLDDQDASENETTRTMDFEKGHWYHVVVRVTPKRIDAWVDKEQIVKVSIEGRKVSLRPGAIYLSEPLGIATYCTTGEIKNLKLRLLEH